MAYDITQRVPIVIGPDALAAGAQKMRDELNVKKVLLTYDPNVKKTGVVELARKAFEDNGLECFDYDKCERDAPEHCCDEIAAKAKEIGADILVAIGGGSTMDASKGACVILGNGGKMRDWLLQHPFRKAGKNPADAFAEPLKYKKSFPIVCIPTTSGTGSEAGSWAVIHDEDLMLKDCIMYEAKFAIIDPVMSATCPDFVTVDCAFDALAHAGESITATRGLTNGYDAILGAGVTQMVFEYLPLAVKEPSNLLYREKLATAATIAGFCLNCATCHIGHSMADGLLYKYNYSHGHACLLALPPVIEYVAPYAAESVRHICIAQGAKLTGNETPEELGAIAAENYRKLAKDCGAKSPKDIGIAREDFVSMETAEICMQDKGALASTPRPAEKEDICKLLAEIYDKF